MGYGLEAVEKTRAVISYVAEGIGLAPAAQQTGISLQTFHEVISSVRELGVAYARVREMRADVLVDEARAAADDPDLDPQRARNMMTIRQWIASKHNSRVYGERVDLNISQSISIGDTLSEARARTLLPVCYQTQMIDAQVLDESVDSLPCASDTISDVPRDVPPEGGSSAAGPDIFD